MAQKIVTLCDVHARNEEEAAGAGWRVTLLPPGESKAVTWEIDLCEDDGKTLRDLATMLDEVGRVTEGPRRKVATAARKAAREAQRGLAAPNRRGVIPVEAIQTAEGFPCPVDGCGKVSSTRKGLISHLRGFHDGMTLGQARGLPLNHVCPECGQGFSRAQGLGSHRRQAHGVVSAEARESAEASPAAG